MRAVQDPTSSTKATLSATSRQCQQRADAGSQRVPDDRDSVACANSGLGLGQAQSGRQSQVEPRLLASPESTSTLPDMRHQRAKHFLVVLDDHVAGSAVNRHVRCPNGTTKLVDVVSQIHCTTKLQRVVLPTTWGLELESRSIVAKAMFQFEQPVIPAHKRLVEGLNARYCRLQSPEPGESTPRTE